MNKPSLFAGTAALFGRSTRQARPDAYALLNRYDDHMLKDVGLTRFDVESLRRGR